MRPLLSLARSRRRSPASFSRRLACVVAFVAIGATAGCARQRVVQGAEEDDDGPTPIPEFVSVAVENHNWSDVIVWVVRANGVASRIGTVSGSSDGVLQFPGRFIAEGGRLQLIARPIGGWTAARSERFTILPGQHVVWTIETSLERSTIAVY